MTAAGGGNAAFYFLREGYETGGQRLMGRHAAGEGFLNAWIRHADTNELWGYAPPGAQSEAFAKRVREIRGVDAKLVSFAQPQRLAEPGAVFMPGPVLGKLAWSRRRINQRGWSIVGVTHTTATERVMEALGELITAPTQPWDAVICTSNAVRSMVTRSLAAYAAYLEEHLGARRAAPRLQLPIIPLGVDASAFDPSTESAKAARKSFREKLGIADDDIAMLWVGRFTHAAKANPWPSYIAAETASRTTGKRIHSIEAGWFASDSIKAIFDQAHKAAAPSVQRHVLDGRDADVRAGIWFAGDIFCSLSDNIQETFGLTPVEAMAAGLPCLVSDWDGYRDTVRHGVDGIRVRTTSAAPGLGEDLASLFETEALSYDNYCLGAATATAVDVRQTVESFTALASNADLRKKFGAAGRERAVSHYDWRHVVTAYQALYAALAEARRTAPEHAPRAGRELANPLRDDPFRAFAAYPTRVLEDDDVLSAGMPGFSARAEAAGRLKLFQGQASAPLLSAAKRLEQGPVSVGDLSAKADMPRARLIRGLLWLAKIGVISIAPAREAGADKQKSA